MPMAHIVAVCRSQQRMDPKEDIGAGELRAGHGLVGDAHAGLSEREVSLLALESIERVNREHAITARPGSFAENLTTQGIDLLSLRVGDLLRVGPTLLGVVQIGKPPTAAHTYNFHGQSILPAEGIFCRVLEGGWVKGGDKIAVVSKENEVHHRTSPKTSASRTRGPAHTRSSAGIWRRRPTTSRPRGPRRSISSGRSSA